MSPCSSISRAAFWGILQSKQKKKCQRKCRKKPFIVKDIPFGKVFHPHKLKIAGCQICFPDSWASWRIDLNTSVCNQALLLSISAISFTKNLDIHFTKTKNVKQKASRDMMRKHRQLLPYSCHSMASCSTINWIVFDFYTVFSSKLLLFKGYNSNSLVFSVISTIHEATVLWDAVSFWPVPDED